MEKKKRNPIIAFVLSTLCVGLGQMYNSQLIKGIIFLLMGLAMGMGLLFTNLSHHYKGFLAALAIMLIWHLISMIDAPLVALRLKEITLAKYNRWYYYLLFVVAVIAISASGACTVREFHGLMPFYAPSVSMSPTILPGDRFEVDTNYYKHHAPTRGDIVVFAYPLDRQRLFIKRVVALAGDKVVFNNQDIYVNNIPVALPGINVQNLKSPHLILSSLTVPTGQIFVVGDNFNNSDDSRAFGPVGIDNLRGKALFIYSSPNRSHIGVDL